LQNISKNGILKPLQQKIQNVPISFSVSVYVSHITIRKTLNGFALNTILEIFTTMSRHTPRSGKIQ